MPPTLSCFGVNLPSTVTVGTTNISPLLTALLNYQGRFLFSVYVQSVLIVNELQLYVRKESFALDLYPW